MAHSPFSPAFRGRRCSIDRPELAEAPDSGLSTACDNACGDCVLRRVLVLSEWRFPDEVLREYDVPRSIDLDVRERRPRFRQRSLPDGLSLCGPDGGDVSAIGGAVVSCVGCRHEEDPLIVRRNARDAYMGERLRAIWALAEVGASASNTAKTVTCCARMDARLEVIARGRRTRACRSSGRARRGRRTCDFGFEERRRTSQLQGAEAPSRLCVRMPWKSHMW